MASVNIANRRHWTGADFLERQPSAIKKQKCSNPTKLQTLHAADELPGHILPQHSSLRPRSQFRTGRHHSSTFASYKAVANHVQPSSKARIANLVRLFAHHGSVVVARPATTRRASPFQWIFSSSGSPHCASTQLFGTSRGWHRTTMATSPDFPSAQLLEKKARVTVQWLLRNGRGDRWLM